MGASTTLSEEDQAKLRRLVGPEVVSQAEQAFWQALLARPTRLTSYDPQQLAAATQEYWEELVQTNAATQHLQKLCSHVCSVLKSCAANPQLLAAAADGVCLLLLIFQHLAQRLDGPGLLASLDGPAPLEHEAGVGVDSLARQLVQTLAAASLAQPFWRLPLAAPQAAQGRSLTATQQACLYVMHLESLKLLLVLASTQLFQPVVQPCSPLLAPLAEEGGLAGPVLQPGGPSAQWLLELGCRRAALPALAPAFQAGPRPGVLRLVRSAAGAAFRSFTFLLRLGWGDAQAATPLGDAAVLLFLVLMHTPPAAEGPMFPQALARLRDSAAGASPEAAEEGRGTSGSSGYSAGAPAIPFPQLYEALSAWLALERGGSEPGVLLLYTLLFHSPGFRSYVLARSDPEALLLPLLRALYRSSLSANDPHAPSHTYMVLVVLLLLSQDGDWARRLHARRLGPVPWYRERLLAHSTLGSLLLVLLLRTAQRNLSRLSDVFFYTNLLATLANVAPHSVGMSAHAAQRLVGLFDQLARRHLRLGQLVSQGTGSAEALATTADLLGILLEIINACLASPGCLRSNPELAYALLHRQDVFHALEGLPRFQDLLANVAAVTRGLEAALDAARGGRGEPSSAPHVMAAIRAKLEDWTPDGLQPFPVLRFMYEQEATSEDFFVPYTWSLVVSYAAQLGLAWDASAIALFSPLPVSDSGGPGLGPTTPLLGGPLDTPVSSQGPPFDSNV